MNYVYYYAMNSRDIYSNIEWLTNCVAKRFSKSLPVTVEHLANCSTMKKITLAAKKKHLQVDGIVATKEERNEASLEIAKVIFNSAKYLAS